MSTIAEAVHGIFAKAGWCATACTAAAARFNNERDARAVASISGADSIRAEWQVAILCDNSLSHRELIAEFTALASKNPKNVLAAGARRIYACRAKKAAA